jgi:hypothetical protein
MDKSVERIIRRVLEEARAKGRDHLAQTELAVRAVLGARPDMTASEALAAVEMVRRKGPTVDELPRYRRFRADGA